MSHYESSTKLRQSSRSNFWNGLMVLMLCKDYHDNKTFCYIYEHTILFFAKKNVSRRQTIAVKFTFEFVFQSLYIYLRKNMALNTTSLRQHILALSNFNGTHKEQADK